MMADREPSPARSGHEGKKAPEGPTPKSIVTRCEPGRLAVRELDAALAIVNVLNLGLAWDTNRSLNAINTTSNRLTRRHEKCPLRIDSALPCCCCP
jgi:hypothetical protein